MRIRKATIEDATAISKLILPLAEKYIAHEFSPDGVANLLASMQPDAIEGYLTSGYKYYIAEEDGLLAGVAAVRDNRHVFHLFVAEAHQGRGVGRRLWEYARDACRKAGKPDAFTVNSSTLAVEMYRTFGFIETGPPETKSGVTSVPMKRTETDQAVNYRTATTPDAALLAELNQQLIRDEGHRNTMTLAELEQRMAGWLAGKYNAVLFERQAETLGYALYRSEDDYVYLRQFFVCPQHRRQGVGRTAIQWLQANMWAKPPRVRVEVLVTNSIGIAFWRSLGFADYCITMEREAENSRQPGR